MPAKEMLFDSAATSTAQEEAERRRLPRVPGDSFVVVQPSRQSLSTFRVDLVDVNSKGVGIRSMIPVPQGEKVVLSIAHPPVAIGGLILGVVTRCTKLDSGWYCVGIAILDQREGNLNTTRIPDAWRKT